MKKREGNPRNEDLRNESRVKQQWKWTQLACGIFSAPVRRDSAQAGFSARAKRRHDERSPAAVTCVRYFPFLCDEPSMGRTDSHTTTSSSATMCTAGVLVRSFLSRLISKSNFIFIKGDLVLFLLFSQMLSFLYCFWYYHHTLGGLSPD